METLIINIEFFQEEVFATFLFMGKAIEWKRLGEAEAGLL